MDVLEPGFAGSVLPLNVSDRLKEVLIRFFFLINTGHVVGTI